MNASWLRQLRRALARSGPAFRDPDLGSDLAAEKDAVARALRYTPRPLDAWNAWVRILEVLDARANVLRGLYGDALPKDEGPILVVQDESASVVAAADEDALTDEEFEEFRATLASLRGPSAPISEGMPGWYFWLTDFEEDPDAPEDVQMHARFAIEYVNDLRNAHRELRKDYDRLHANVQDLRAMRDRARDMASTVPTSVVGSGVQRIAHWILTGEET